MKTLVVGERAEAPGIRTVRYHLLECAALYKRRGGRDGGSNAATAQLVWRFADYLSDEQGFVYETAHNSTENEPLL